MDNHSEQLPSGDVTPWGLHFRFFFDAPSHTGLFTVTLSFISFLLCMEDVAVRCGPVFSARYFTTQHALEDSSRRLPLHSVISDFLAIFKIFSSKLLELGHLSKQFLSKF